MKIDYFYLWGSQDDDDINGGQAQDFIYGKIGDDVIHGNASDDTLFGQHGNDEIHGDEGNDNIYGGFGDDHLFGGLGDDYITGDDGHDILYGNQGRDNLKGGNGNDELNGGADDDRLFGGAGNDLLIGGSGNDNLQGNEGADVLKGDSGDDSLQGGEGDDVLYGYDDNDYLNGGNGNDVLHGGTGNDSLASNSGDDDLYGGAGDDRIIVSSPGKTLIHGGDGADYINVQAGENVIHGDAGNDYIYTTALVNTLSGGSGDDRIYSSEGNDSFIHDVISNQHAVDYYSAGAGHDVLTFAVEASIAGQQWYQQAISDFNDFLLNKTSDYQTFDFQDYDPMGEYLQLTVSGFDELNEEINGEIEEPLTTEPAYSGLLNGEGQTVAVIDTGLAWDLETFGASFADGGRVVGGWDFAENDADPYDDNNGHGTHVTSIIASEGNRQVGWAPAADIVALRVFNDQGELNFSWMESALQWVLDNINSFDNPITTINISAGVTGYHSNTFPIFWTQLEDEFAALKEAGVFISVSAGNSFGGHTEQGLGYPAISPHVIPVASHSNSERMSSFSQRNDDVIVADGEYVKAYVPDYAAVFDGMKYLTGTSMAAPQVAGASVVLRELMEIVGIEEVTQETIYQHMRDTSDLIYDSVTDTSYHQLNLAQAIDALMPEDGFADELNHAEDLGEIQSGVSVSGFIEAFFNYDEYNNNRLIDVSHYDSDYFQFTATQTSTISFTANALGESHFSLAWLSEGLTSVNIDGNVLSFNVVAGQQYTVGLTSNEGLGYYNLSAEYQALDVNTLINEAETLPVAVVSELDFITGSYAHHTITHSEDSLF